MLVDVIPWAGQMPRLLAADSRITMSPAPEPTEYHPIRYQIETGGLNFMALAVDYDVMLMEHNGVVQLGLDEKGRKFRQR